MNKQKEDQIMRSAQSASNPHLSIFIVVNIYYYNVAWKYIHNINIMKELKENEAYFHCGYSRILI